MKNKNRFDWFKEKYCPTKIISVYETMSTTEIVADRGGDIARYRVYGDSEDNYIITVK